MSYGLCDEGSGVRHKQQQLAAKQYSAGVIAYYWCVNKRLDGLCHHNVFLSGDTCSNAAHHNVTASDKTGSPPQCEGRVGTDMQTMCPCRMKTAAINQATLLAEYLQTALTSRNPFVLHATGSCLMACLHV